MASPPYVFSRAWPLSVGYEYFLGLQCTSKGGAFFPEDFHLNCRVPFMFQPTIYLVGVLKFMKRFFDRRNYHFVFRQVANDQNDVYVSSPS